MAFEHMTTPSRWTGIRFALRRSNYRLFVAGQLVSLLGTWTRSVAQGWLVFRLTGSAVWLGVIAACQQLPVVVLASLGGSLADRHQRRTILVATQSASMMLSFALAGLALSGTVQLSHMIVLAVLAGAVAAVDIPTRQSFIVELVGREGLMTAVAINSSMAMCAASLGPVLAGYGVQALGEGWCFFADGVSFAAVIAGLLMMRGLPAPATARSTESLRARIAVGFRFARNHSRVRNLLGLLAITAFAGLPCATLLPMFAAEVFHGDARALGGLSAAIGLGALCGAVVLGLRPSSRGADRWVGGACGMLGACLVGFALSHRLWLSIVLLVPIGAATMIQVSATNTLIQIATPDALRGRVMAIWAMILMGFAPLGGLLAGWVASRAAPGIPLAIGGVVCVLAALRFMRWSQVARAEQTEVASQDTDSASREGTRETPH
ncbi:MAG TPA: MFS transporter [Kofleriaceae bacterium]|nr:MFS transporter [Kofleriaceae bacterium]